MSKMLRVSDDIHKKLQFVAVLEDKKLIDVIDDLISKKIVDANIDISQINLNQKR